VGAVALLFKSSVFVERDEGLRGIFEYRQARYGLPHHLSGNEAVRVIPHGGFVRQACVVQQRRRDAAVAVAGDDTPPVSGQTCLLCRLVAFDIITHFSFEKSACSAFYVPTQKVRAPTCVMIG